MRLCGNRTDCEIKGYFALNIGLFTDTYFPQVSGVATSIKTLRDELVAQGHHVYIFTTTDPLSNPEYDRRENIYRFHSIPFVSFTERRIALTGWLKILRLAKKLNLDIVHNQTEFSLGLMGKEAAREMGIPVVHTYHTMYSDYLHYIANGKILKPKDVAKLVKLYMKGVTGVIAPSDRVLDALHDYGVSAPIEVIPTGVNLTMYQKQCSDGELRHLRQRLGFSDKTPVLLALSRLAYEKNIHEIIEALPDILAKRLDARLVIVGDGPARQTLERQVSAMDLNQYVQFTGTVPNEDVHLYYQMANVLVSASDTETQGLTYIEALASGLPIVVMRSPYTDQLIDDPAIGRSFQKRSDLVSSVIYYLNHPNTKEGEAKRQEKLHNISSEVFGRRVTDFYRQCQQIYRHNRINKRRHNLFGVIRRP